VERAPMTYIIKSYSMPQEFIDSEIENALNTLYSTNQMLFDYWLSELYDDEDQKVVENWTEGNLKELYKDVDYSNQEFLMDSVKDKVLENVI
jgi:translation elongation factor EF-Ts